MRVPTKKLEKHTDRQKFPPAARRFAPTVFRKSPGYYQKFTVDFHQINEEISKTRGKKFSAGTLFKVREAILNSPLIKVIRRYAAYVWEVIILPFDKVQKNEESDRKMNADSAAAEPQDADTESDLDDVSERAGIEQQQLIDTARTCRSVGIKYDKSDLPIIAAFGVEAVKAAVEMYKIRSVTSKIKNPPGWLRRCLERGWYQDYEPDEPPTSMFDALEKLLNQVLDSFGTVPSSICKKLSYLDYLKKTKAERVSEELSNYGEKYEVATSSN